MKNIRRLRVGKKRKRRKRKKKERKKATVRSVPSGSDNNLYFEDISASNAMI